MNEQEKVIVESAADMVEETEKLNLGVVGVLGLALVGGGYLIYKGFQFGKKQVGKLKTKKDSKEVEAIEAEPEGYDDELFEEIVSNV